jgi:DNA-binding response OmpR family regulator
MSSSANRQPAVSQLKAAASHNGARRRVLIVDDDVNLARLIRLILRSADYDVLTATDGYGALDITATEPLDVIVLDLVMPILDGRGFYRELRARGNETPVLVASANGARSAQMELGAQGSIEKPFDPEVLLQAVNDLLSDGRTHAA